MYKRQLKIILEDSQGNQTKVSSEDITIEFASIHLKIKVKGEYDKVKLIYSDESGKKEEVIVEIKKIEEGAKEQAPPAGPEQEVAEGRQIETKIEEKVIEQEEVIDAEKPEERIPAEQAFPVEPEVKLVTEPLKANKIDEAYHSLKEIITAQDTDFFRQVLEKLFAQASGEYWQLNLLRLTSKIENNPDEIASLLVDSNKGPRAPPELVKDILWETTLEAINEGQLFNNIEALLEVEDNALIKLLNRLREYSAEGTTLKKANAQIKATLESALQQNAISIDQLLEKATSAKHQSKIRIITLTGGTAVGTLLKDALEKAGLLEDTAVSYTHLTLPTKA